MAALQNGRNGLHATIDVAKGWTRELSRAGADRISITGTLLGSKRVVISRS